MYSQSITRTRRTAFVLAVDCSGSMAEQIIFDQRPMSKAEAVAAVANSLLFELTERARRSDGIRDYYDVAVIGYSGEEVKPLLSDRNEFLNIIEIARLGETKSRTARGEYQLPDGSAALLKEVPIPTWIRPESQGETPMYEALLYVRDLLREWTMTPENADSFPPVVFNITDGEASDCDDQELHEVTEQIRALHTNDGHVLLINIHIASGTSEQSIIFPTADQVNYGSRYASLLYDCSSEMPEVFTAEIREIRGGIPPFRGMSYNASVAELISVLNIGSISVKTE